MLIGVECPMVVVSNRMPKEAQKTARTWRFDFRFIAAEFDMPHKMQ